MLLQNKKAEITGETVLKIIISVFVIMILLYVLVSLYGIFTKTNKLEQAKATLKAIVAKAEGLEKEGDTTSYLVNSPKDWYLIEFAGADEKPKICYNQECLCICNGYNADKCDDKGTCLQTKVSIKLAFYEPEISVDEIKTFLSLKILPKILLLKKTTGKIEITTQENAMSLIRNEENFNSLMNHKIILSNNLVLSIKEAIFYYLNSETDTEKQQLREEIQNAIRAYSNKNKITIIFYIITENDPDHTSILYIYNDIYSNDYAEMPLITSLKSDLPNKITSAEIFFQSLKK